MDKGKFGEWLNDARKQKGMTQEQLAVELNYTKQAISKWEQGKGMPNNDTLVKLEGMLGPIPGKRAYNIEKYANFKVLSKVKECKEYDDMFNKIIENIEIDPAFSASIKYALNDLLWTTLYCYRSYEDDDRIDMTDIEGIYQDWFDFTMTFVRILSDKEDFFTKNIEENHAFKSASLLKQKIELFLDKLSDDMENHDSLINQLIEDELKFSIAYISMGSMERLYNILPDTVTSWKSSFVAAAYMIQDELYAVYSATRGWDKVFKSTDEI